MITRGYRSPSQIDSRPCLPLDVFQDAEFRLERTSLILNSMQPNREDISISALFKGETEDEIQGATCGDQVRIRGMALF